MMTQDACDLGLMHGIDQAGGGACTAENVTDVYDGAEVAAIAPECRRDQRAQEPLFARRRDGFEWETGGLIDVACIFRGNCGNSLSACDEVRTPCRWSSCTPIKIVSGSHMFKLSFPRSSAHAVRVPE